MVAFRCQTQRRGACVGIYLKVGGLRFLLFRTCLVRFLKTSSRAAILASSFCVHYGSRAPRCVSPAAPGAGAGQMGSDPGALGEGVALAVHGVGWR